jgi:hypothetical protein
MKTIKKDSRKVQSRNRSFKKLTQVVKETTVVLFGSASDPDVKASMDKLKLTGRGVEHQPRPSFDTGVGMCGRHLCNCKTICKKELAPAIAFQGDPGASMGTSF